MFPYFLFSHLLLYYIRYCYYRQFVIVFKVVCVCFFGEYVYIVNTFFSVGLGAFLLFTFSYKRDPTKTEQTVSVHRSEKMSGNRQVELNSLNNLGEHTDS